MADRVISTKISGDFSCGCTKSNEMGDWNKAQETVPLLAQPKPKSNGRSSVHIRASPASDLSGPIPSGPMLNASWEVYLLAA